MVVTGTMQYMVPAPGRGGLLTQMRKGALEYCVLALLRDTERYGFDLVRSLGEIDGLVVSEGTIYPLLGRLRRDGMVESMWRESDSGPPRRYYRLTRSGRQALVQFTAEWARFSAAVNDLLARKEAG